jgi:hypothetical protein
VSWWESVVKAVQLKPRYLFGIALAGFVVALLLPDSLSDYLGMTTVLSVGRGWVSLAAILAFCLGIVQLFPSVQEWWCARKHRAIMLAQLDSLSKEEKLLLAYCVSRKRRTLLLDLNSTPANVAAGLSQKGLMQPAMGTQNIFAWPHTVPTFVWEEIVVRYADFMNPQSAAAVEWEHRLFQKLDWSTSGQDRFERWF